MIYLLFQAFGLLLLTFLVGLPLGDGLARLFRPKARPVVHVVPEPEAVPVYHGFELSAPDPEPVAVAEPIAMPPPAPEPEPAPKPWSEAIVFPVHSFGFTVKCCPPRIEPIAKRSVKPSALAGLPMSEQHALLARTRFSQEPERLWQSEGAPDDLTMLDGLDAEDAARLNALGVFHTWQIAEWQPPHVLWLSRRLKNPHRIVTDDWIGKAAQAAAISA